jgi:hypothetical protein
MAAQSSLRIDPRNRRQFLQILETLKCPLALSRRSSGVALPGMTDGGRNFAMEPLSGTLQVKQ